MVLDTVRAWFRAPRCNLELARAQFKALSTQIPLLYAILIVNTLGLAATHVGVAPALLAVYAPLALCACCLFRLIYWWRWRHQEVEHAEAIRRMRATVLLAGALGIGFTTWALSLYPYGDAYAKGHVAFYMAITVIGCIFCLMHLRAAALVLTCVVIPPLTLFLLFTGNPVFVAISANVAFVALALIVILFTHYRDFTNLIEVQKDLVAKNAETQRLSDENLRLATFNQLTGLPKRRQFFSELTARIERARTRKGRLAIALVDLSGFRSANHIYGHTVGDGVLVEAGRRLSAMPGASLFVARLGADEFGVIIDDDLTDDQLRAFGASTCEALREPYVLPGASIQLAASIGLAAYPDAADSAQRLFERADFSLIHQELRGADLDRELSLMFQPIVDMDTQRTVGLEALARWTNPRLGAIPPAVFITAAERLGLINRLTETLLEKALAASARWPRDVFIAFNLSAHDIVSPEAMDRIVQIARASGIEPGRISFEVTETAAMRDFDQACKSLRALKQFGARIGLDDFGTGYSSLSHVHRLPLDEIKVDRSFIVDIENDFTARDVVRTVMDLCRNLNLVCVVEGAETPGQALILRSLGCRMMQGYLFSRPLDEEQALAFLSAEREAAQFDDLPDNVRYLLDPVAKAR
jgi:diguanylate cyclase (GGDEF)-like protein